MEKSLLSMQMIIVWMRSETEGLICLPFATLCNHCIVKDSQLQEQTRGCKQVTEGSFLLGEYKPTTDKTV